MTAALYLDDYGLKRTLRLGCLIHPRARPFRKNGLTTRAEGGTHWTIDRFEKTVTLHVRTVASRGRPHILDVVEGLSCYICRQWRLDHIEKTMLLHEQTVEPRTHREDRYATCADGSASWSLQILSTLSSNRLATCADGSASSTTLRYMCGLALPCMALPHAS